MDINLCRYDHYGLPVLCINANEYAFAENEEAAEKACTEGIENSYWAFNNDFIKSHLIDGFDNVSDNAIDTILNALGELAEGSNEAIKALIKDTDCFVQDAISADGAGHFLAPYDGEELEYKDVYREEFYEESFEAVTKYIKELLDINTEHTDWLFYRT